MQMSPSEYRILQEKFKTLRRYNLSISAVTDLGFRLCIGKDPESRVPIAKCYGTIQECIAAAEGYIACSNIKN